MGNYRTLIKTKRKQISSFLRDLRDLCGLMWQAFSIRVLKRRFGIENKAYMEWHDRRAYRLQCRLDMEHCTNYAKSYE